MVKNQENLKFLGIDWGEKRIGLALADGETKLATPFKVVGNLTGVLAVIKEEEIDRLILGAPLKMRDSRMGMNEKFLEFVELLKRNVKLPVELIDERLSSQGADALIGNYKTKAPRDALAAMLILQTYLDQIS